MAKHSGTGPARPSQARGWRRRVRTALGLALAALVVLGFAGCGITIGAASPSATAAGDTAVPIKVLKGQDNSTLAEVPIYINGQGPYPFILDTGASISLIETPLAQRFSLPVVTGSRQNVSGVGGSTSSVLVRVAHWRVGKVTLPAMTIARASAPSIQAGTGVDGLIGSDIWSSFGAITINYQSGTLTIDHASSKGG